MRKIYVITLSPEERSLLRRLEIHYTPKHGSWLNMAEGNSAFWGSSAWIAGLRAPSCWSRKRRPGKPNGIRPPLVPTGSSPPRMLG